MKNIKISGNLNVNTNAVHVQRKQNQQELGKKERVKQSIEDLKVDDIASFVDGIKNLNDMKAVLKQILYTMNISKEITVTHKIKGRRNANRKR